MHVDRGEVWCMSVYEVLHQLQPSAGLHMTTTEPPQLDHHNQTTTTFKRSGNAIGS